MPDAAVTASDNVKARLGPQGLARLRWVSQQIDAIQENCKARFPFPVTRDPMAQINCLVATPFNSLTEERDRLCQPDGLGDCTHFLLGYGSGTLARYSD